jgi:hypothetical protein
MQCRIFANCHAPRRPQTGEPLPDDAATASSRAQDRSAPKARHLQSVIHVVGACTRSGDSSGQQTLSNRETCHEYY